MANIKKINLFICGLLVLIASLFFVACGPKNYDNVTLTSSTSSVPMNLGEQREITFTINNMVDDMDNRINLNFSTEGIITADITSIVDNTVHVTLTAVEAGITTMTATTLEGGKSCDVSINVSKYSNYITPATNSLFVSTASPLTVSASDFVFESNSTHRNLNYYFYGINNDRTLTLDNVSSTNTATDGTTSRVFRNQFVSVKLINQTVATRTVSYLIFTAPDGSQYTLGPEQTDLSFGSGVLNLKYDFVEVSQNADGSYVIPQNATPVLEGEKFTFVAYYPTEDLTTEIYTQREFVVLKDILQESIISNYGYAVLDENGDILPTNPDDVTISDGQLILGNSVFVGDDKYVFDDESITLVPKYIVNHPIEQNYQIDFKRAKLFVALTDSSNLIKYKFEFDQSNIFNVTSDTLTISDGNSNLRLYIFEISTRSQTDNQLNFTIHFYYDGFENSANTSVNQSFTIPVSIQNRPENLYISGANFSNTTLDTRSFVFYNNYQFDTSGWQRYYFSVAPNDSEYESLTLTLPAGCGVQVRRQGEAEIFTATADEDCVVEIKNLANYVEFKGINGAEAVDNAQLKLAINYNIVGADSLEFDFNYSIQEGSTMIAYDSLYQGYSEFAIAINGETSIDFSSVIYTDAEFNEITVQRASGNKDVVRFDIDEDVCRESRGYYYLNFSVVPIAIGRASYSISLPNGLAISVSFNVVEQLNTVMISSTNQNANMDIVSQNDNSAQIYARYNSSQTSAGRNSFDIQLASNFGETVLDRSDAILTTQLSLSSGNQANSISNNYGTQFDVNINSTGTSTITLTISGYQVDNFVARRTNKTFTINITNYEYINAIGVDKQSDGQNENYPESSTARYVYLYTAPNSTQRRTAQLELNIEEPANSSAFLFQDPVTKEYVADGYLQKFVYWTIPTERFEIRIGDEIVSEMHLNHPSGNIYQIYNLGVLVATFDVQNLTLILASSVSIADPSSDLFILTANINQYQTATKAFAIHVRVLDYEEVNYISVLTPISSLEFSSIDKSHTINLRVLQSSAINKNIRISLTGDSVSYDGQTYKLFGNNNEGIDILDGGSIASITLTADDEFINLAVSNSDFFGSTTFNATLTIAAEDWYDDTGLLLDNYRSSVIQIAITFANGTESNRFTIDSVEDLQAVSQNLSAHYQITTTIDASSITQPLGKLEGSIVGSNKYASITGVKISSVILQEDVQGVQGAYGGLFTSLGEKAYIENLSFEGGFDFTNLTTTIDGVPVDEIYLGLVAGKIESGARLTNVSVNLQGSSIEVAGTNQNKKIYIGGVVGYNSGDIVQDFSSSSGAGETKQDGKLYSYTIYMHGTLDIKYTQITTYTGGIAGYSDGLIKKIDGQTFTGYTNYMAYSLINLKGNGASYLGAGVGYVSVDSQTKGILGYIDSNIVYGQSGDYVYSAGKGVVVGGEVCGDGYVGGVVGYFENKLNDGIESYNFFAGVTTRTFVRSTSTNAGYITGEISTNALMPIFYIQAIDDKRAGDDASMLVFNVDSSSVNIDLEDYNKLALGQNCNLTTFGDENGYYAEYFVSYLRRTQTQIDQNAQIVESQDGYYGEAVVISENDQTKTCLQQKFFETKGQTTDLAINGNFTVKNGEEVEVVNEMTATNSSTKAFYAFYFNAVSAQSENDSPNLSLVQENLNTYFNTQTSSGKFYPINVTGEMTLTSLNSNILDIDQTGQITIKGTGWVQISGSSILNSNDGISFYIFVTNFFNYDKSISIIYPNTSQSATALDNATISMFANDTVVLYVRPNYQQSVSIGDNILNVNANGSAILNGFAFNMATNRDISADIEITKAVDGNDNDGNDNDGNDNGENGNNEFSTSSSGQTIIITKKQSSTTTDNYSTIITPKISGTVGGVTYSAKVNKELTGVKIDYSKGALAIGTGVFDGVTISTSNSLNDRIYIRSTAEKDDEGVDYYVTFNGERITTEDEDLFTVSFGSPSPTSDTGTIKEYYIPYTISVNRDSESYKNRFNEDIYGQYVFTFVSQTNSAIYCNLTLNLENQALQSIVIDNYINQRNMTTSIGNSTLYAYPGSNGLLAVTLSPDDSDFDYLVIENADENSNNGNGVARFSLAGRLNSPGENENLFEANTILGSATSQGLVLTKDQLLELHRIKDTGNLKYQNYTGIVYFIYNIGNSGVVENGTSRFIVNIYKDNQLIKSEDISLTLRLQNFVSVSIEGKTPEVDGEYLVARGLRYKLVIDSFGFNDDNISTPKVTDGNEYASIVQENGEYYVQITSGDIGTREVKVAISVEAVRYDDERKVSADDTINLNVMQFVINSAINDISLEDNNFGSLDIITNMSGGVVTVSIGSTRTIEVDIYDYIEYDTTNQAVINAVNGFVRSLTTQGDWKYWTNIAPGQSVPAIGAGEASYPYVFPENELVETYYFDAEFDTRNNVGVTIRPRRINEAEADLYYFTYSIRYQRYENSYAILTSSSEVTSSSEGYSTAAKISTKIRFEVFVSSSMETPIPIFDYEDFLDMHEGGYYILLNDITLPSSSINSGALETVEQFTPITANFASLDGNGHSIIWDGVYDFGASGQLGVFSSLSSGSIISNLNIVVRSSYDTGNATYGTIFNTTNAEHRTGLLVGVNNGIITNCKVYSPSNTIFTINCALANIESAYFGSIAGENNGYITNCTSSINVYGSFNIAGIAGINNGTIGASAYKEGTLVSSDNQIDEGFHVAGLVNVNSTSGKIVTSYVTGGITENSLYTTSTSSYLSGPNFSAGFVYENAGEISDCYSDIYLANSGNMAGFVYVNTGSVKNSFSLSILQNNTIASAGFAMRNVSFDEEQESVGDNQENVGDNSGIGTFENCYYLSHLHTTNCPAGCQYGKNINIDLNTVSFDGVSGIDNFDVTNAENEYFDSYAYTNYISTIGVWFYTGDETISTQYIEFEPTDMHTTVSSEDDTFGTQVNTNYEIVSKSLPKGRLELSAPNIDALSIRNFSYADVDTETGNITYHYVYDMATEATRRASDGSIYNPYIIYDAQSMEIEMTEQTNSITGQNSGNYRLVSDIDYTNYEDNSNLYNTIFIGNFEGNGMEINYIVLQSNAQMEYAGLFAGLGVSSSKQGVIKNLVLTPSVVNFAGAVSVGALVGYVNHGHIYNVDVTTDNNLIVQGGNFVGGVVGRASGSYVFKNITSNVNAIANYTPVESDRQNIYTENQNASVFSYAGGLFGHLGTGSVENVEYTADQTIRANFAGLAFGGLGQGANVSVVKVTNNDSNIINAYTYGGLIAGEISGSLTESVVYNSGSRITPFSIVGQTPIAVGGIAGVLSGGNITKAVMRQSFTVTEKLSASNTYSTIQNVGGLVGMVRANASQMSYISQAVVEADITAVQNLGGAVGNVASPATIDQVAVKPETTQSALRLESNMTTSLYLGGIIGRLGDLLNRPQLVLTNSYCLSDLTIVASRANSQPQVYVGGLLGSGTQNLTINNCYTASYINARLVNMMNMWDDSQAYFNGITDREAPVSFYLQTSSNDNIQNTYYYGANGGARLSIVENFVSVMANFELSGGAISINNYGQSSYDYSGISADTSLNPIYNVIFDDDINAGIWTGSNSGGNSNSTFRTLVFENDLYWI